MVYPVEKWKTYRFERGALKVLEDEVIVENLIELYLNGRPTVTLHATPSDLEALALGYLLTEGLTDDPSEVYSIRVEENRVYLEVSNRVGERARISKLTVRRALCGEDPTASGRILDRLSRRRVCSKTEFTVEEVIDAVRRLNLGARLYRRTGGAHTALIRDKTGFTVQTEDVGRHNAIDKAVGLAVLRGLEDFSGSLLACSGRLSSEIVLKAGRVGFPILVSNSAPTSLGLNLAEKLGLTLIGFARGLRFNVYSYPDRIVGLTPST